ncbi:MAG: AmmeMemoRadiSam system protein B [Treponema sp.]|jgi:AmmeMemoRadiSam system protein B|nr:AmmeMemoRadiSam system protein B [Treponema sp.]
MIVREPCLPPGWYPRNPGKISRFLTNCSGAAGEPAAAAIAPHAGWFYSGRIAAAAVSALNRDADTVVVAGGHLPAGAPPLFAEEGGVRTPLGIMPIDTELRTLLQGEIGGREDRYRDNTVEVLLPMVHFFLPQAKLLWLRLPADMDSLETGKRIAGAAASLGRKLAVLGSTDLTHYGDNYIFSPHGRGEKALRWVRELNDRAFIEAVEVGNPEKILERAETDRSSCSAGAVLCALGYAQALGRPRPRLLAYGTSADAEDEVPGSFVGYAAFSL